MSRSHAVTVPQPCTEKNLGDSRLGDYRMISRLARGGSAAVYLAEHVATGERFALKLLDPALARRGDVVDQFLLEHDIAKAAHHAGLVDVHAADRCCSGVPYLVMELLEGGSLGKLVDRDRVSIEAVLSIGGQIAAAASALHRAGYIHCDIKPDNVFVLYEEAANGWPRIKLIDYGVARAIENAKSDDGMISGTPAYMPPEQWHGEPTSKSDVYALGCLLYELIVGEQPFHGSLTQLAVQHLERLAPRPSASRSDTPPALDALVARMLAKDPAMRPAMAEVEAQLSQLAWPTLADHAELARPIAS